MYHIDFKETHVVSLICSHVNRLHITCRFYEMAMSNLGVKSPIHFPSDMIQNELSKFTAWCSTNKLTVNVNKTKTMLFGSRLTVKNTHLPKTCP